MFNVAASGSAPLRYAWLFNGKKLSNTGNIRGATSAVVSVSKATSANAGKYSVVVTNALGSITSKSVALTVQ